MITQNFDSTWRLFDSDDYYDWFGGLYNAASILRGKSGLERPDTAFVDIRNKNKYVSRTYQEEIDYEIRTMLLNPKYYMPLITGGGSGMNAYAARYQNMFGGLTVADTKLGKEMGNQLSGELLGMSGYIDGSTSSFGYQTSLLWMVYLADQGTWDGDASTVKELINEYMRQATKYGVACCHHTCKNLAFNAKIIQMSSLTPAEKQKFAEILAQATNTDPLYQMQPEDQGYDSPQGGSSDGSANAGDDSSNAQQLANGTSDAKSSSSDGGNTAVGSQPGESGDAKSSSDAQSSSSSGSSGAGDSGAKAFELSDSSAAKSASSAESNMPIFVVIAVIILIVIFLVGYVRNDEEDYDDY